MNDADARAASDRRIAWDRLRRELAGSLVALGISETDSEAAAWALADLSSAGEQVSLAVRRLARANAEVDEADRALVDLWVGSTSIDNGLRAAVGAATDVSDELDLGVFEGWDAEIPAVEERLRVWWGSDASRRAVASSVLKLRSTIPELRDTLLSIQAADTPSRGEQEAEQLAQLLVRFEREARDLRSLLDGRARNDN